MVLLSDEKDMVLLAVMDSLQHNDGELTCGKPNRQKTRERTRFSYIVDGRSVCRETFKFLYK